MLSSTKIQPQIIQLASMASLNCLLAEARGPHSHCRTGPGSQASVGRRTSLSSFQHGIYGKFLCYQLLPFVIDYKLMRRITLPALVDRCVVLANLSASCFLVLNHAQIQSTPCLVVGLARNNSAWNRGQIYISTARTSVASCAVLMPLAVLCFRSKSIRVLQQGE